MARQFHNMLVNRIVDRNLSRAAQQYAAGRMLDIGCGVKPYREQFADYIDVHVGVDHPETLHGTDAIDILATAYEIPVRDASFDTVLCTAVLEHLEDPQAAIREAARVLRPGGHAIYVAPFIWHLHEEPRDFFRYTKYGLAHLFEAAGFTMRQVAPLAGFWVTFGQMFVYYLYRFNRGPLRVLPIIPAIGMLVQCLAYCLDRLDRADRWTWAYLVVAYREHPREP